ncbi:MAG: hypothetical protein Q8N35_15895 [Methylococcaceae bacterium]|nr:hypothetical protein [Methylococcaceae bacterium]MDZ4125714.1 hypothetical protein [Hydrogenophaga sp.]MDZ4157274.1 hypothetical protein [Methylococcales bacterium]MDP2392564.1 hypothetical protein [Methylococcaceae bacterium]MDP3021064.1 hypothetical protein [Methylococcaceae bacterium]
MNNQEQEIQVSIKPEEDVTNRRRFIKGAGITTPVVLTLSSRSVFGALCASESASGNESHVGTGSCVAGFNSTVAISGQPTIPTVGTASGITSQNNFQSYIVRDDSKWTKTDPIRDTCVVVSKLQNKNNNKVTTHTINLIAEPSKDSSYSWVGGVKFGDRNKYEPRVESIFDEKGSQVKSITFTSVSKPPANTTYFKMGNSTTLTTSEKLQSSTFYTFTGGATYKGIFGTGPDVTFREILNNTNQYKKESYLATAFLNTKIIKNYALSEQNVRDLAAGTFNIPKGYTFESFLEATWK